MESGIFNIVAILSPSDNPHGYLSRAWCMCEMYTALATEGCSVEIVMQQSQKDFMIASIDNFANCSRQCQMQKSKIARLIRNRMIGQTYSTKTRRRNRRIPYGQQSNQRFFTEMDSGHESREI